jgi:hypothetical protein
MSDIEVIPFYTKDAERAVREIIRDTEDEIRDLQGIRSKLEPGMPANKFRKDWEKFAKPSEEFDFYQDRLQQVMADNGFRDKIYADMYDEFSMIADNSQGAQAVVRNLQNSDTIMAPMAQQLDYLLEYSEKAREDQLEDFGKEQDRLQDYVNHLDEIVGGFEQMNQYQMPLESVDQAMDFWRQVESFEDRVERMRSEREDDYSGNYNSVNPYGFFQDVYNEEIGVGQPVERDIDAVESRSEEAKRNIIF